MIFLCTRPCNSGSTHCVLHADTYNASYERVHVAPLELNWAQGRCIGKVGSVAPQTPRRGACGGDGANGSPPARSPPCAYGPRQGNPIGGAVLVDAVVVVYGRTLDDILLAWRGTRVSAAGQESTGHIGQIYVSRQQSCRRPGTIGVM